MKLHDLKPSAHRLQAPDRRRALFTARDLALTAVAAPAWAVAQAPAPAPAVVVMHGFADQQSITLWLQGRQTMRVMVEVQRANAPADEAVRRLPVLLDAETDCCASLRIPELQPGITYRYQVRENTPGGSGVVLATGSFRSQAHWQWRSDPPTLRLALGSCAYLNDGIFDRPGPPYGGGEEIFDQIAAAAPDLMLWLGDNIYLREPEWTSREGINRRYRFYREHPRLQRLWSATSHIAIWDDHDFGPNDADASFVNKAWTLEMFRRYWPQPFAPQPDAIYGQVTLGDVDIFMLDDRSFRYPNRWPEGPDKAMYGEAQMHWLRRALMASNAPFKLVAGGGQFFNQANRFEAWSKFPAEQQAMRRWLDESKVPGVVFLSGDRHFSELLRIERPGRYPLHELTTSPLSSGPVRRPDEAERNNPDLVPGTFYNERNFALLTVSGPRTDRMLTLALHDTQGRMLWERSLKASALV